ncbi:MAG TPA: heavy metal-associated domain-containing protein, partial [Giesbergeria sp.]|nr:heavy metal-associated domain-containing protein [Giesbergeria sp.]
MNTSLPTPSEPHALDLSIGGMTCASCVGRVERALRKVPGVQDATVNLATESARVQFAAPEGGDAAMDALLRRAVRNAGYEPLTPAASAAREQDESPWAGFSRSVTSARMADCTSGVSNALLVGTRSRLTSYLPITSITTRAAWRSRSVANTGAGAAFAGAAPALAASVEMVGASVSPRRVI